MASVTPFEKVLRGFERVPLAPGQTRTVRFKLNPQRDLKMLDQKNEWVVEPGRFDVLVSTSSAQDGIELQGHFNLQ